MKESKRAAMLYRARKWLVKNPRADFSRYLYHTGDHTMDRTLFEIARNETPEIRTKFLREHLFKSGGIVPTEIHAAVLKSEAEQETEAPREYERRTIKGALPPAKFPPARRISISPERKKKFDRFIMQDEPEAVIIVDPPEMLPVPIPVPVPSTLKESEDTMPRAKENYHRIMTPKKPKAAKAESGLKLSAVDKALGNLQSLEVSGDELPSHNEYKRKFESIPAHTFYGARNKFLREEKKAAKAGPNGRGKPAEVFIPAPAGGGSRPPTVEIIYSSDTNPEPVVMIEVEKVVRDVLTSFARNSGFELANEDLQIRAFAGSGWEIRRVVK